MTAIATAAPSPARLELYLAVRRTAALASLRAVAEAEVDRLLDQPRDVRETPAWAEQFRQAHNTLWRREEHLISAIDAERTARNQLTESQEGRLS